VRQLLDVNLHPTGERQIVIRNIGDLQFNPPSSS
jgi:hypothetical protein